MTNQEIDPYAQSLIDRVTSLSREIDHLRNAYIVVNDRLNNLTQINEQNSKELIEEAARVEDFARLAVEATLLTEKSALITNNSNLITAAQKSSKAAKAVYELAVELRFNKISKLLQK